ncbi:hypothetical protein [Kordia sp. SMS9]|uniref:hypothetical protein n=1 Tax=Kordia sp. SMS9 TaxID=2282170 RepID=UPI0013B41980|nr:hypothetical protein [Kordia sp. SMS9]
MAFEKALEKKLVDGTFVRIVNTNQLAQSSLETTFQCTHCDTEWILSVPDTDSEWQGYFLPNDQLTEYEEYDYQSEQSTFQTNFKGGKGNCGCCLGLFLGFVFLIIYIVYSFFDFILGLFF